MTGRPALALQAAAAEDTALDHPARILRALEAVCVRHETPCGEGSMVWRRWGQGSPLVLLHGGGGAWSHWVRNIGALAQAHTVWVPDLPGLGESAMPEVLSIEGISDALERGLWSLISDAQLSMVSFSFGGAVASCLAARLGERLDHFALVASRFILEADFRYPTLVSWKALEGPDAQLAAHRRNLEIMMIANPDRLDALALHVQSVNTANARYYGPKLDPGGKLHEYLPLARPRISLTGISGREDQLAKPIMDRQGAALRDIHPSARFHVIEGAGHWVQYEAAEAFNQLLVDRLKR